MAFNKTLQRNVNQSNAMLGSYPDGDSPAGGQRAFPGAEGLAALTRGAAGYSGAKSIAFVDNLNDSGAGSLREAIEGTGKEGTFVIIRTSGVVNLLSILTCRSDFITIAGQTSPGGFCTAGNVVQIGDNDTYNFSDIVIRHMRFRAGSHGGAAEEDQESFRIWKSHDIMIDHCSMSWGADETVSLTTFQNASVSNVTFSNCIVSEGLTDPAPESNHGYGLLFNGSLHNTPENSFDMHHSYFVHHNNRMPQLSGAGQFNIVNNVVYDFDATQNCLLVPYAIWPDGLRINYIGNYIKRGTNSNLPIGSGGNSSEITAQGGGSQGTLNTTPYEMLHMINNFGVVRTADTDADWTLSNGWSAGFVPETWRSLSEFSPTAGVDITKTWLLAATAEAQATTILADVGATIPSRDSHDTDMVNDFINDTGTLRGDVTYPGDWPTYATPSYPTDTDGDGIPDSYWTFRSTSAQPWDDIAPSGYLWIEDFFNDLADGSYSL